MNEVKAKNKVGNVLGWNSSRPTQITCQEIQGLILAILELHEKGICHGFLDHQENILLKFGNEQFVGPHEIEMIDVILVHDIFDDNIVSQMWGDNIDLGMKYDISHLFSLIFNHILKRNDKCFKLPVEWMNLREMIKKLEMKVKTHPCLWLLKQRTPHH